MQNILLTAKGVLKLGMALIDEKWVERSQLSVL